MLKFVVLVGVQAEFLELFAGDDRAAGLLFLRLKNFFGMVILVGSEAANFDFACCNCALGVNDDGDRWVLDLLVILLRIYINAGQPAAITRVRMIPSTNIFRSTDLLTLFHVLKHVRICILACVDTSFRGLNRQSEGIHYVHRVADRVALHVAHDFNVAARPCVHYHLDQSDSRYFYLFKMVWVRLPRPSLKDLLKFIFIEVVGLLLVNDFIFEF